MSEDVTRSLRDLVADVAAAYFENTHVAIGEIGTVIDQIARSLGGVGESAGQGVAPDEEAPAIRKVSASQIRRSITPEALISFEDGRPYKTLRRHLSVKGLTPDQYREKWGLPHDYPMVSANYSAARSKMAKDLGLGNRRRTPVAPAGRTRRRRSGEMSAS